MHNTAVLAWVWQLRGIRAVFRSVLVHSQRSCDDSHILRQTCETKPLSCFTTRVFCLLWQNVNHNSNLMMLYHGSTRLVFTQAVRSLKAISFQSQHHIFYECYLTGPELHPQFDKGSSHIFVFFGHRVTISRLWSRFVNHTEVEHLCSLFEWADGSKGCQPIKVEKCLETKHGTLKPHANSFTHVFYSQHSRGGSEFQVLC